METDDLVVQLIAVVLYDQAANCIKPDDKKCERDDLHESDTEVRHVDCPLGINLLIVEPPFDLVKADYNVGNWQGDVKDDTEAPKKTMIAVKVLWDWLLFHVIPQLSSTVVVVITKVPHHDVLGRVARHVSYA